MDGGKVSGIGSFFLEFPLFVSGHTEQFCAASVCVEMGERRNKEILLSRRI